MKDKFLRDGLGWVDDFAALPGQCGQPLTRMIYAYSLMKNGASLKQLKELGFSRELVSEISEKIISEEYDESR